MVNVEIPVLVGLIILLYDMYTFLTGCDVKLTSDTGVIQSPGYGVTMYPGIAFCSWLISPTSASSIRLVFEDFDLEENIDFLKVSHYFVYFDV